MDFNLAELHQVRRVVVAKATACGLPAARADEIALAVNEIATNAVLHGRPPATLRIWAGDAELTCEVSDAGDGIKDPLAGQLAPAPDAVGGRGIWLARMLCEAVEIRNGAGCTVSLRVTAPELELSS
jgi:anti-sigma regulatory factor (Ser/Thr protein kinase)